MYKVSFPNTVKPHYCTHKGLATALEIELFERFGSDGKIEDHPYPPLYNSGRIVESHKPMWDLGFVLVDSQQISDFKDQLTALIKKGPRVVDGIEYYKIHCSHSCIVLTSVEAHLVLSLFYCS